MNEDLFKKMYLQEPQPLKIGDAIKLRNTHDFSIKAPDTNIYEVMEFLDKGDLKIKEVYSGKVRIINSGRISEAVR